MAETLAILKDTPIPNLLIIGGIALLVLSVASNVAGKVQVARERQKWAGIAGLILVAGGVLLHLYKPAGSITATPTPAPSPAIVSTTAAPVASPAATSAPTLATCINQPRYFQDLWTGWASRIGCPLSASSGGAKMTGQAFEHGWMFRRPETRKIYVLLPERQFVVFEDAWQEGDPAYSCPEAAISQTPPTPREHFGAVWCQSLEVRAALGAAVDDESSFTATWQAFDNGLIFSDKKQTFILIDSTKTWEVVE